MHTGTFTAFPVRAHEAEGAEREELWRLVNDNYPGYELYQQRAGAGGSPSWSSRRAESAAVPFATPAPSGFE